MSKPNEIELPLERIEDALVQCAIPGFYGELRLEIRINPAAALEVELLQERKTITQKDVAREDGPIIPSHDRVAKVRRKLPELQEKLRLICPVSAMKATFKDGHLISLEFTDFQRLPLLRNPLPVAR